MKQYPLPAGTSGADSSTTSVGIMLTIHIIVLMMILT
jgi:hypothetical protein